MRKIKRCDAIFNDKTYKYPRLNSYDLSDPSPTRMIQELSQEGWGSRSITVQREPECDLPRIMRTITEYIKYEPNKNGPGMHWIVEHVLERYFWGSSDVWETAEYEEIVGVFIPHVIKAACRAQR